MDQRLPRKGASRTRVEAAFDYLSEAARLTEKADFMLSRVIGLAEPRDRVRELATTLAEQRDALWGLWNEPEPPRDEELSERMSELAWSFPCLRNAPGVSPFRPEGLDRWAASVASHGERVTASFILAVWDASTAWEAGRFDLMEALNVWSPSHREPFLGWVANPWWP